MVRRFIGVFLAAAVLGAVPAPAAGASNADGLWAKIRRTEFGIPHILARDYRGLGYGLGYAFAQDNICTIAETYVTVDAQRSRFFGPDGSYLQGGNGITVNNLNSDLFFKAIADSGIIEELLAKPPPVGPKPAVFAAVSGYVAGYNRYLRDVGGSGGIRDPRCRGAAWVRPISDDQVWRRFYQLILLAGYDVVIDGIAQAAPPPGPAGDGALPSPEGAARMLAERGLGARGGLGSNAVAVGSRGTRNGRGLLLGNPHFPWVGSERFYQAHLTIPGRVNVQGASLYGVPAINIGHTETVAWSHTVSTAFRFTPYQLTLVPGAPTTYLFDGAPLQMEARQVSVMARRPDGSLQKVDRTLWWTRFGPVFTDLVGVPLPWTPTTAFAIRDVNVENFRVLNHFFDVNRAQTVDDVLRTLKRYQGIPWVNTIAADRRGHTLYADIGAIPHVTDEQAALCNTELGQATFELLGLPVLDGSRSQCDWGTDQDSVVPGTFGPSNEPFLLRRDYVTNSNDSYWLSNSRRPLEGFDRIIGTEGSARTLRTRIGLELTAGRITGKDGLGPAGFTRRHMQRLVFVNRSYAALITKADLVGMCREMQDSGAPTSDGPPVPVGNACDVLARWGMKENLSSRGAVLFRRFWDHASQAAPTPFAEPFDPARPVRTPRGLATENPQVRAALGDAISELRAAGVPLAAKLGAHQFVMRGERRVPIHGGDGDPHGDFNAIWTSWTPQGLSPVVGGTSYVQVVTWNDGPCPDARTILSYGLSENPASPHFVDQTLLFSRKKWVKVRFCEAQIANSPSLRVKTISE